ncbi:phosphogluconate dehydrogenase (NAD(+)-dependent, decarboxylating) [Dermatophilus congolensis]|uniref:6-phosphogluconate dehydrogenase, decarboxylating n=1 Tax=Dermatophilus congolensis TaxID=1863 RepID=A0AA46H1G0_9MICO|nr:decarboxylating 6-phosphogluconate dehydrogenase [Dermatophilus congolensis]MBO3143915.1 decarboxylating 6-phosphogluconate dehydrogenase [Dermatophilus congolensis]MBO3152904.1 decarboxylating 6-phosphogluconate dehydrogenase [Dermatophilus congolensis]MBO3160083.1 decarboxylating 6-phosphogluconate dehydrogenase [Dermatophilus congolensis]MBO3164192.1 decarboxylating 6-phosphogluconate dehydrogenase [Dermatophilus congolensis]MBO3177737.1 decarboxylating 6-phosphogluconate dehydrogenase [
MKLGLIGLGKMGGNMRERLRRAGHEVVGFDTNPQIADVSSVEEMIAELPSPRVVWVMVPDAVTGQVIEEVAGFLSSGDLVIDGGNSPWYNDEAHAALLAQKGAHFVDCGVSGGVWGLQNGYALMVGGPDEAVALAQPIFDALRPQGEFGFVHAGGHGAGHFAKMVHNGIEYGLMQAYAEGWELLEKAPQVVNVPEVFKSWREGTVIRSWLLDLMDNAMDADPHLDKIEGYAADSGEGRWTVNAAVDLGVPVPTISAALFARFVSQQKDSPAMKMVAAMRKQFGGHATKEEADG